MILLSSTLMCWWGNHLFVIFAVLDVSLAINLRINCSFFFTFIPFIYAVYKCYFFLSESYCWAVQHQCKVGAFVLWATRYFNFMITKREFHEILKTRYNYRSALEMYKRCRNTEMMQYLSSTGCCQNNEGGQKKTFNKSYIRPSYNQLLSSQNVH